jgi:P27 family predicted phage terminase small subunit
MAGRNPKPTALKLIQGTMRSDRANPAEPKPTGDLIDAPKSLSDSEKLIWDYAIQHAPKGLLKLLDLSTLEVWVTAYAFHREAKEKVKLLGQVIKTPSGYPVVNPYLSNVNKQAQIMLKSAAEMGFTPASRSRIVMAEAIVGENPFAKFA